MNNNGSAIRIISFDAEGTLASHAYSRSIWQEVVPAMYGELHGLAFEEAAERVFAEYATIGPGKPEWYDIGYWFRRLGIGDPVPVLEAGRSTISFYPDVMPVLGALQQQFVLVVASSTPEEFLRPLLRDVEGAFARMFSSTSSLGRLKDEAFYRWLCREMDAEPGEVVHIGDHLRRDYESASRAGLGALYLDRTGQCSTALHSLAGLLQYLGLAAIDE